VSNNNQRNIENKSSGHLSTEVWKQKKRIENLEKNAKTEHNFMFGRNPWIALGTVFSTLALSFGSVYSWQFERVEKSNKENIERISKEYESRITWLKEQQKKHSGLNAKQCKYELFVANNKLSECKSEIN
jgi:hypothetical protein